jgi:hypothetical protein
MPKRRFYRNGVYIAENRVDKRIHIELQPAAFRYVARKEGSAHVVHQLGNNVSHGCDNALSACRKNCKHMVVAAAVDVKVRTQARHLHDLANI